MSKLPQPLRGELVSSLLPDFNFPVGGEERNTFNSGCSRQRRQAERHAAKRRRLEEYSDSETGYREGEPDDDDVALLSSMLPGDGSRGDSPPPRSDRSPGAITAAGVDGSDVLSPGNEASAATSAESRSSDSCGTWRRDSARLSGAGGAPYAEAQGLNSPSSSNASSSSRVRSDCSLRGAISSSSAQPASGAFAQRDAGRVAGSVCVPLATAPADLSERALGASSESMTHDAAASNACLPVGEVPSQLRVASTAALAVLAQSAAAAMAAQAALEAARDAEAAAVAKFDMLRQALAGGRPTPVDDDASMSRVASCVNGLTEAFIEVQDCARTKRAAAAALAAGQVRLSAAEREWQSLMAVLLAPGGSVQAHGAAAEAIGAALAAQAFAVQHGHPDCEEMDAEAGHGAVGAHASINSDWTDSASAAPGAKHSSS